MVVAVVAGHVAVGLGRVVLSQQEAAQVPIEATVFTQVEPLKKNEILGWIAAAAVAMSWPVGLGYSGCPRSPSNDNWFLQE
jgi:hypothetical protein